MMKTSTSFEKTPSHRDDAVSLSEVTSAMTFALDLTEGAVPGHGLRSCLLGMRLAASMEMSAEMRASLYYALQLKDAGCSSNAARVTQIVGGDDRAMKAITKLSDWDKPLQTMRNLWPHVLPEANVVRRAIRFTKIGISRGRNTQELIKLRCERGAEIVQKLNLGPLAVEAVRRLDELWDGSGYPGNLAGKEIPLLARICAVAQILDVFAIEAGTDTAMKVLLKRSGTWFDPEIVSTAKALHDAGLLWTHCRIDDDLEKTRQAVVDLDPGMQAQLTVEHMDAICEALASVVDAKSPFTYTHSQKVAEVAVAIADELKLEPERVQLVRRAALLHDVGKLKVSNTLLDKASSLTEEEWAQVKEHPEVSRAILRRVSAFGEIAAIAGEHHERLDGSGYPLGLTGERMSLESRLVCVADSYAALAEARPYREAIAPHRILKILAASVPEKLDARCFTALRTVVLRKHGEEQPERWSMLEEDTQQQSPRPVPLKARTHAV